MGSTYHKFGTHFYALKSSVYVVSVIFAPLVLYTYDNLVNFQKMAIKPHSAHEPRQLSNRILVIRTIPFPHNLTTFIIDVITIV